MLKENEVLRSYGDRLNLNYSGLSDMAASLATLFLCFIVICGGLGNLLVIWAFGKQAKRGVISSGLILLLACIDLIICLGDAPATLYLDLWSQHAFESVCRMHSGFKGFVIIMSPSVHVLIAVERFLLICFVPAVPLRTRSVCKYVFVAFMSGLLFSVPMYLRRTVLKVTHHNDILMSAKFPNSQDSNLSLSLNPPENPGEQSVLENDTYRVTIAMLNNPVKSSFQQPIAENVFWRCIKDNRYLSDQAFYVYQIILFVYFALMFLLVSTLYSIIFLFVWRRQSLMYAKYTYLPGYQINYSNSRGTRRLENNIASSSQSCAKNKLDSNSEIYRNKTISNTNIIKNDENLLNKRCENAITKTEGGEDIAPVIGHKSKCQWVLTQLICQSSTESDKRVQIFGTNMPNSSKMLKCALVPHKNSGRKAELPNTRFSCPSPERKSQNSRGNNRHDQSCNNIGSAGSADEKLARSISNQCAMTAKSISTKSSGSNDNTNNMTTALHESPRKSTNVCHSHQETDTSLLQSSTMTTGLSVIYSNNIESVDYLEPNQNLLENNAVSLPNSCNPGLIMIKGNCDKTATFSECPLPLSDKNGVTKQPFINCDKGSVTCEIKFDFGSAFTELQIEDVQKRKLSSIDILRSWIRAPLVTVPINTTTSQLFDDSHMPTTNDRAVNENDVDSKLSIIASDCMMQSDIKQYTQLHEQSCPTVQNVDSSLSGPAHLHEKSTFANPSSTDQKCSTVTMSKTKCCPDEELRAYKRLSTQSSSVLNAEKALKQMERQRRPYLRTAQTLVVVMTMFIISYTPYLIQSIIPLHARRGPYFVSELSHVVVYLYFLNSAINPVIHFFLNKHFNQKIKRLCAKFCRRLTPFTCKTCRNSLSNHNTSGRQTTLGKGVCSAESKQSNDNVERVDSKRQNVLCDELAAQVLPLSKDSSDEMVRFSLRRKRNQNAATRETYPKRRKDYVNLMQPDNVHALSPSKIDDMEMRKQSGL